MLCLPVPQKPILAADRAEDENVNPPKTSGLFQEEKK
jgi:hypothetical protein